MADLLDRLKAAPTNHNVIERRPTLGLGALAEAVVWCECDLYRDGGSYGIKFKLDSDPVYELFLQVQLDVTEGRRSYFRRIGYDKPILIRREGTREQREKLEWSIAEALFDALKPAPSRTPDESARCSQDIQSLIGREGRLPLPERVALCLARRRRSQ